ncbi:hypothetical protein [Streptomyces sp. 8K308]|uniref:hypothetical protein n=1 Tax=Streptomyces sp. 8K308 TaxID=2530388 RepID=UPI001404B4E7|nr:hypothetical protein [Streptomyces sp. 8K308]
MVPLLLSETLLAGAARGVMDYWGSRPGEGAAMAAEGGEAGDPELAGRIRAVVTEE